jgi:hypothetical protein
MDNRNVTVQRSWWDRNWKWLIPTGCLSLILIFSLFIGGIFYAITSSMKNSAPYKEAIKQVQKNKLVTEKLGDFIESDGMITGEVNISGPSGTVDLQIPIKGTKGEGVLVVVADKQNSQWKYKVMHVNLNDSTEQINLLKNN